MWALENRAYKSAQVTLSRVLRMDKRMKLLQSYNADSLGLLESHHVSSNHWPARC
jgi:hypothetical protein